MTTRELRRIRRLTRDGSAEQRRAATMEALRRLAVDRARLDAALAEVRGQYARHLEAWTGVPVAPNGAPSVEQVEEQMTAASNLAAVICLTLELTVSGFLAIDLLEIDVRAAFVVGWLTTMVMTILSKAICAARHDIERPRESMREIRRLAIGASSATMILTAAFYSERVSLLAMGMLIPTLSALAVMLPIAAGAWSELARQVDVRNALARRYRRLASEADRTRFFEERIREALTTSAPAPAAASSPGTVTVTMVLVAIGLGVAAAPPAWADATPSRVVVALDATGSPDGVEYRHVLDELSAGLLQMALDQKSSVREIALVVWASAVEAYRGPSQIIRVPHVELPVATAGANGAHSRLLRIQIEEEQRRLETRQRAADVAFDESVRTAFAPFAEALRRFDPANQSTASCVDDAIARLANERAGSVSIVVSDGQLHKCRSRSAKPGRDVSRVLLVLLPAAGDKGAVAAQMDARARRLTRAFPTLTVVPSFQISAADLGWLKAMLEPGVARSVDLPDAVALADRARRR